MLGGIGNALNYLLNEGFVPRQSITAEESHEESSSGEISVKDVITV